MATTQNLPIFDLPNLDVSGLVLSNNATTPNSQVDISAGTARDMNNVIDLRIGANNPNIQGNVVNTPLTLNMLVNGLNGLDTGAVAADTLYAIYLVGDSRYYNPVGALATLASNVVNNVGPLMPFGYDSLRLIGFIATNGSSNIQAFREIGNGHFRQVIYAVGQQVLGSGNATAFAEVDVSALVPPINNTMMTLNAHLTPGTAGDSLQIKDVGASTVQTQLYGPVISQLVGSQVQVLAQLSSNLPVFEYQVSSSGDSADIWILGYTFFI